MGLKASKSRSKYADDAEKLTPKNAIGDWTARTKVFDAAAMVAGGGGAHGDITAAATAAHEFAHNESLPAELQFPPRKDSLSAVAETPKIDPVAQLEADRGPPAVYPHQPVRPPKTDDRMRCAGGVCRIVPSFDDACQQSQQSGNLAAVVQMPAVEPVAQTEVAVEKDLKVRPVIEPKMKKLQTDGTVSTGDIPTEHRASKTTPSRRSESEHITVVRHADPEIVVRQPDPMAERRSLHHQVHAGRNVFILGGTGYLPCAIASPFTGGQSNLLRILRIPARAPRKHRAPDAGAGARYTVGPEYSVEPVGPNRLPSPVTCGTEAEMARDGEDAVDPQPWLQHLKLLGYFQDVDDEDRNGEVEGRRRPLEYHRPSQTALAWPYSGFNPEIQAVMRGKTIVPDEHLYAAGAAQETDDQLQLVAGDATAEFRKAVDDDQRPTESASAESMAADTAPDVGDDAITPAEWNSFEEPLDVVAVPDLSPEIPDGPLENGQELFASRPVNVGGLQLQQQEMLPRVEAENENQMEVGAETQPAEELQNAESRMISSYGTDGPVEMAPKEEWKPGEKEKAAGYKKLSANSEVRERLANSLMSLVARLRPSNGNTASSMAEPFPVPATEGGDWKPSAMKSSSSDIVVVKNAESASTDEADGAPQEKASSRQIGDGVGPPVADDGELCKGAEPPKYSDSLSADEDPGALRETRSSKPAGDGYKDNTKSDATCVPPADGEGELCGRWQTISKHSDVFLGEGLPKVETL